MIRTILYSNYHLKHCFCQKPSLLTTPKENELVCKNCGVTFGYDSEYNINTIPSYHITKSSKINLFQRKQNGSNPSDHKQIIKYKKLRVSNNNSDLACFSIICDKLELPPIVSEQCYRLYQKLKEQYPKFTRAKSICLSIYLVCRKNTIPYDEQNLRDIVCQTLGVKNAPKFKSVIFKINKNLMSDLDVNGGEITSFYSSTSESKEKFYLNLHISEAQKRMRLTDVSDLKRLTLQYYDQLLCRFYANDDSKIVQLDYNTKAKRAVLLALQRCIITA